MNRIKHRDHRDTEITEKPGKDFLCPLRASVISVSKEV
jgi:hypothetical protein